MIRALYSAASGMSAQQTNVDNIAHNLANASTVGFKMRRAQFQDLLYQSLSQPGAAAGQQTVVPSGLQIGLGTRAASNEISFVQGSFSSTDNPLDLVIQGKGFFQVRRPTGELAYTRAGAFHLSRDGQLVTSDGDALEPQITIPPEAQSITIAPDGTVSYMIPGQTAAQTAGTDSDRQLHEPGWTEQPGTQSLYANGRLRRSDGRDPRRAGGNGKPVAGISRAVQRQRSRGVCQPDRQPARVRGQLKSGQGGGRDVSADQ